MVAAAVYSTYLARYVPTQTEETSKMPLLPLG